MQSRREAIRPGRARLMEGKVVMWKNLVIWIRARSVQLLFLSTFVGAANLHLSISIDALYVLDITALHLTSIDE
jgi:hypothetical protein